MNIVFYLIAQLLFKYLVNILKDYFNYVLKELKNVISSKTTIIAMETT